MSASSVTASGAVEAILHHLFQKQLVSHFHPGMDIAAAADGLRGLLNVSQNLVAQVHEQDRAVQTACRAGCCYCCHAQVRVTPLEILVIHDHIRHTFSPGQLQALSSRIKTNRRLTEEKTLEQRAEVWGLTPCLFLENGRCQIYSVRPLICRAWNSLDRNACLRAYRSGDAASEIDASTAEQVVYGSAREALMLFFETQGLENATMELPVAMEACLTHARPFFCWINGGAVFETGTPILSSVTGCPTFMQVQVPSFFRRFSLSYEKDGGCNAYYLYSKARQEEISTALVVSHDRFARALNVSRFYPEIYRYPFSRYMSATCFFMMIHHAARSFGIQGDCPIMLETREKVFDHFYCRLPDFHFMIQHHRVSGKCCVKGLYHDIHQETGMITPHRVSTP